MLNLCMPILDHKPRRKSITARVGCYITNQKRYYDTGAFFWTQDNYAYKDCYNYWYFDFRTGKYRYDHWRGRWDDNVMSARFFNMANYWKYILLDGEQVPLSKFATQSQWVNETGYDGIGKWYYGYSKDVVFMDHYVGNWMWRRREVGYFPFILHQIAHNVKVNIDNIKNEKIPTTLGKDLYSPDNQYPIINQLMSPNKSYTENDSRCSNCSKWRGTILIIHYEPLN